MTPEEREEIAHRAGRRRGDEVCRVPGADRDATLAVLRSEAASATHDVLDARVALANAHGRHARLLERLADGDVGPREEAS